MMTYYDDDDMMMCHDALNVSYMTYYDDDEDMMMCRECPKCVMMTYYHLVVTHADWFRSSSSIVESFESLSMRSVAIMFLPFFIVDPRSLDYKNTISSYVPLKYVREICKRPKSKMAANGHFFIYGKG